MADERRAIQPGAESSLDALRQLKASVGQGGLVANAEQQVKVDVSNYLSKVLPLIEDPSIVNTLTQDSPFGFIGIPIDGSKLSPEEQRVLSGMTGTGYWGCTVGMGIFPQGDYFSMHDVGGIIRQNPRVDTHLNNPQVSIFVYNNLAYMGPNAHVSHLGESLHHRARELFPNSSDGWRQIIRSIPHPRVKYQNTSEGIWFKAIEAEDFVAHPELFPLFLDGVSKLVNLQQLEADSRIDSLNKNIAQRIAQETIAHTIPGATVNLPTDQPLTPEQVRGIVDQAIATNPRIQQLEQDGATKGELRELMTALMETTARDTRRSHGRQDVQQAYATLREKAQGDVAAQQAVEAFIRNCVNLADPERVLKVLVDIVGGFVPGAHGLITIVEALNDWLIA